MAITTKKDGSILLIGGKDISKPGEYLDDQSLRESINFSIDRSILTKRKGTTVNGSVIGTTNSDATVVNGVSFNREGVDYNVRVGLDKIEYDASTQWNDITGTDLTAATTDLVSFATPLLSGKRLLCITNGIDVIHKWTGSGNATNLGGGPPRAKFIQEYKTYLVAANITGGTDVTQRIQWSDTADPENWLSGNAGAVDLVEDGEDITGLNIFGAYLTVHKRSSIYLGYPVSSTNIFQFDRKATGSGAIADGTIVNLPTGEQIFLSFDGIHTFNGISAPLIESPINEEIRSGLNSQHSYKATATLVKSKDEVWIAMPIGGQTTNETIYKFNYITRVIYNDNRPNTTAMWLGKASDSSTWDDLDIPWDSYSGRWNEATTQEDDQINISDSDGYTYKVDDTALTDNGKIINASCTTKDYQVSQDKIGRWRALEIWARGGNVTVEYSIDAGENWITIGTTTLDAEYPSYTNPDILYFDVVGQMIRFRISNVETTSSLSIKQMIVHYKARENRR